MGTNIVDQCLAEYPVSYNDVHSQKTCRLSAYVLGLTGPMRPGEMFMAPAPGVLVATLIVTSEKMQVRMILTGCMLANFSALLCDLE